MTRNGKPTSGAARTSPLIPVGLVVLGTLMIPIVLYSIGPDGPIKAGDLVFSTGRHRVPFVEPDRYRAEGYRGFCVLEPRRQLLVMEAATSRSDGALVASSLGPELAETPFCPATAHILMQPHQATLQANTFVGVGRILSRLF